MPKTYVSRSFEIKAIKALNAWKKKNKVVSNSQAILDLIQQSKRFEQALLDENIDNALRY